MSQNNQVVPIKLAKAIILETRPVFQEVISDESISFEKEAGFATQSLMNNPYLLDIAMVIILVCPINLFT